MIHLYLKEVQWALSQAAHDMLRMGLKNEYGIHEAVLAYSDRGKPYLPGGPSFSISHSRGFAAVAISDRPVGLDLERVRSFSELLPERVFSRIELEWFRQRGERREDFFTLWTLKECYYKYLGTGLPGFPNGTEFFHDGEWHLRGSSLWFSVLEEKNLLLTLCGEEQSEVMIHRL